MNVLFTAAGSIGSRHIKNLTELCGQKQIPLEIDVLRRSQRTLPAELAQLIRKQLWDYPSAQTYDVGFVTGETKAHYGEILALKRLCRHLFIEKPILDDVSYPVRELLPQEGSVYYVACPIRFSKYFAETKKQVDANDVYCARMIFSSYMPNWQKGRDYRKSFRCFAARGGGVDIDSLHEIDMMTALFGFPQRVQRAAGKFSDLEMDAPDLSAAIFTYPDKLVELHLDYFGRVNNRRTELFCRDDVITVDYHQRTVVRQLENTALSYDADDRFYQDEMRYFIDLIRSEGSMENINPVGRAFANLKLAKGCSLTEEDVYELL